MERRNALRLNGVSTASQRPLNMDKYKNKYRIASTRLQTWDYGSNASYFVTINTKNRLHYFGNVCDAKMELSEIGRITETEWLKTFEMRPDMNLLMADFVVMPNHFHAIIIIGANEYNMGNEAKDAMHCVSTGKSQSINQFGPQLKNLASIIRGFKSAITINARKIDASFAWQPSYHEHIIRNSKSFNTISTYIQNNPKNWVNDKFNA
ncbi:MAG: transposase [Gelidibacter sp.]